jgi:hypothetical protein
LQIYIDSSKRLFDIDLDAELKYLKNNLNVTETKYPSFWRLIHPNFNIANINKTLQCPMNYMTQLELNKFQSSESTIPISEFFVKTKTDIANRKKNKKVEDLIDTYSLQFYDSITDETKKDDVSEFLLLQNNFEELIADIQKIYISSNYKDLFSWLIDRCFLITNQVKVNKDSINKLNKNRSLLFKTLYTVNPKMFLDCFKKDSK